MVTDAQGLPLVILHTAANRHESPTLPAMLDALPVELFPFVEDAPEGTEWLPPPEVVTDKGYDAQSNREAAERLGFAHDIPKRGQPHPPGLGQKRVDVERGLAWFSQFRRLRCRWERRHDVHQAFLLLAAALICFRRLLSVHEFC